MYCAPSSNMCAFTNHHSFTSLPPLTSALKGTMSAGLICKYLRVLQNVIAKRKASCSEYEFRTLACTYPSTHPTVIAQQSPTMAGSNTAGPTVFIQKRKTNVVYAKTLNQSNQFHKSPRY